MKRVLTFLAVFLVVLTISYLQPVFFPENKTANTNSEYGEHSASHTSLPHEELQAQGFATYIGKDIQELQKEYGEPTEIIPSGFDYDVWVYGTKVQEYFEVNVSKQVIQAIKAFSQEEQLQPFWVGMSLIDMSELTTIYSNFNFDYQEEHYDIELMEEDMNYYPLVAFDNETFGILHFSQGTGKLEAVTYLNKKTLLSWMPYQLNEGERLPVAMDTEADWATINQQKASHMTRIMNFLRYREYLASYRTDKEQTSGANKALTSFLAHPEEILKNEDRLALWQVEQEEEISDSVFVLSNEEFQELMKKSHLENSSGLLSTPIYDETFRTLIWWGDAFYHSRFSHKQRESLGVAFSKENVLVLLKDSNQKTEESDHQ